MKYECAICKRKIPEIFEKMRNGKVRSIPSSMYWKSTPPFYSDIVEVYCSAECSLKAHSRREVT